MRLLPVHCDACGRSCLATTEVATARCWWCERPARVVPGANYGTQDMRLFQEVEEAMHSAIDGRDAAMRLLSDLSWVRPDSPSERLSLLDKAVPSLSAVRRGEAPADQKLLEGMALTVLDGMASTRARPRSGD